MWVKKEPSTGKIRYCERYTDYMTGKKKDVSITFDKDTRHNRKEAQRILQERINADLSPEPVNIPFSQLVAEYEKDQERTVKKSTYTRNHFTMNTLTALIGADTLVDRITARYVKNRFIATGKSAATLNEYLKRFKALMRWGYKADLIGSVAFLDKIEPFRDREKKAPEKKKYMESEELHRLLAGMEVEKWKLLTEFLVLSGLRCGEAIALDRKDVDLNEKVIRIRKTYDTNNKIITSAKTDNSMDDVAIQPELEAVIAKINSYMLQQQLFKRYRTKIFMSDEAGNYLNYFSYNKYLKETALATIGRPLTAHSLRHTHASLLFEQGFTLDEVARRLRHGNSKVTREIYIHVTQRLKEKDAKKIQAVNLL